MADGGEPCKHAPHDIGWALDVRRCLAEHTAWRGTRLLAAAAAVGITWELAQMWPGGRARERQIKRQAGGAR